MVLCARVFSCPVPAMLVALFRKAGVNCHGVATVLVEGHPVKYTMKALVEVCAGLGTKAL